MSLTCALYIAIFQENWRWRRRYKGAVLRDMSLWPAHHQEWVEKRCLPSCCRVHPSSYCITNLSINRFSFLLGSVRIQMERLDAIPLLSEISIISSYFLPAKLNYHTVNCKSCQFFFTIMKFISFLLQRSYNQLLPSFQVIKCFNFG